MDGSRFDVLAKALHTAPSRRRFLGSLAGITGAAVAGRVALDDAFAQEFEANDFDLTCRQDGIKSFCFDEEKADGCGPNRKGCRCARARQGKKNVCVEQPRGDCPTRRSSCRRNSQCGPQEVCINVKKCCRGRRRRGTCARRCAE